MFLVERVLDASTSLVNASRERAQVGAHPFLSGLFAPTTEELHCVPLALREGALPAELQGTFARVGPNAHVPPAGGYHLFDGDGFVVAARFDGLSSSLSSGWVRTTRFELEAASGKALLKLGDLHGAAGLALLALDGARKACGLTSLADAGSTANTALVWHAGRLMALNEGDVPWLLHLHRESGEFETEGSLRLTGAGSSFTAHPKICPATGELLFFGYRADSPRLTYGVLDSAGELVHTAEVALRAAVMMHDFQITERYAVFFEAPLRFDPSVMVSQDRLPFSFQKEHGLRIGLLPRRGTEVRWFTLPGCMIFHSLACWEDGPLVRLFACRMEDFSLDLPASSGSAFDPATVDGGSPTLFEFVLDTATGKASQACAVPLPSLCTGMDFPTSHPALVGRSSRWGYLCLFSGLLITGVVKVDLRERAIVGRIDFPAGTSGGECLFVPRQEGKPSPDCEDDGFLLTYGTPSTAQATQDEQRRSRSLLASYSRRPSADSSIAVSDKDCSQLWVMDAKTMRERPLAILDLPSRVPWGFHSTYVPAASQ